MIFEGCRPPPPLSTLKKGLNSVYGFKKNWDRARGVLATPRLDPHDVERRKPLGQVYACWLHLSQSETYILIYKAHICIYRYICKNADSKSYINWLGIYIYIYIKALSVYIYISWKAYIQSGTYVLYLCWIFKSV